MDCYDVKGQIMAPIYFPEDKTMIIPFSFPLKVDSVERNELGGLDIVLRVTKQMHFTELAYERLENYLGIYTKLKNLLSYDNLLFTRFEMFPTEYCTKDRYNNEVDPLLEEFPAFIIDIEVSQKRLYNTEKLKK